MNANEKIRLLRETLQAAKYCHGKVLTSMPPRDAWEYHQISEKINQALAATAGPDQESEARVGFYSGPPSTSGSAGAGGVCGGGAGGSSDPVCGAGGSSNNAGSSGAGGAGWAGSGGGTSTGAAVAMFATRQSQPVSALIADLTEAATTLRRYETLHRAKGTAESTEKAEVNAALATRFEATIAKAQATP